MQIDRFRGDTSSDSFTILHKDGTVVDLTGCSLKMTVSTQNNPTDTSAMIYQLTGVVTNPAVGVVTFSPNSTQTDHVGICYYDVEFIDISGVRRTLVKDIYNFIQDITK